MDDLGVDRFDWADDIYGWNPSTNSSIYLDLSRLQSIMAIRYPMLDYCVDVQFLINRV